MTQAEFYSSLISMKELNGICIGLYEGFNNIQNSVTLKQKFYLLQIRVYK